MIDIVIERLSVLINLYGVVPVSYTHLDVYKRQVSTRFKRKTICNTRSNILEIMPIV